MIIGIPYGETLSEYHQLVSSAPIKCIEPPALYLSSPEEELTETAFLRLSSDENFSLSMRAVICRNLYNPKTSRPALHAACLPSNYGSACELRCDLGVINPDPTFVPNFIVIFDGMQNQRTRSFFKSYAEVMAKKIMHFNLFVAQRENPDHAFLFEGYNPLANEELSSYTMYSSFGGSLVD